VTVLVPSTHGLRKRSVCHWRGDRIASGRIASGRFVDRPRTALDIGSASQQIPALPKGVAVNRVVDALTGNDITQTGVDVVGKIRP